MQESLERTIAERETESEDLKCDGCAVATEAPTAVPAGVVEREVVERETAGEDLRCDGCAITTGTATALPVVDYSLANTSSTAVPATETSGSLEGRCDGCASSVLEEDASSVPRSGEDRPESLESDSKCDGCA